jgi:DNA-binding CsgD family transcriptional regulator
MTALHPVIYIPRVSSDKPPLPAALDPSGAPYLVGRQLERDAFDRSWDRMASGHLGVALVGGPPGVGKTRLVAEVAANAHRAGAVVLHGAGRPDFSQPFQAFVEALRPLTRWHALQEDLDDSLDEDLDRFLRPPDDRSQTVPTSRGRLFDSIARILSRASAFAPLLLVIEDAHWAGPPSLELLQHLVRSTPGDRILLVVTFRTAPPDRSEDLARVLGDVYRHPGVERIDLEGLSVADILEFLVRQGESPSIARRLAGDLRDLTNGNPYFLSEVWKAGLRRNSLADMVSTAGLPPTVGEVIWSRLAHLAPEYQQVLMAASVSSEAIESEVVAEVAAQPLDTVLAALDAAVEMELLVSSQPEGYSFVHELARQALSSRIPVSVLGRLHGRFGKALSERYAGDPDRAASLAHHFSLAPDHRHEAHRYAVAAGEHAERALAFEEAALHFLAAAGAAPDDEAAERMQLRAGRALVTTADFAAAREAFAGVCRSQDPTRRAQGAIGFEDAGWRPGRFGSEAVGHLMEAWRRLGSLQTEPLGVRVQCHLARALSYTGDYDQALKVGEIALTEARRLDDPRLEASALIFPLHTSPDVSDLINERVEQAVRLVESIDDVDLLGQIAYAQGVNAYVLGNPEEWQRSIASLKAVADLTGQPFHRVALLGSLGAFEFTRGHYEKARRLIDSMLEPMNAFEDEGHEGLHAVGTYMIERETGLQAIAPLITGEPGAELGGWMPGLLAIYTELEMVDATRTVLDDMMAGDAPARAGGRYDGLLAAFLTEAIVMLGDRGHAEVLYDWLEPRAGTNLLFGYFLMVFGSADRYLGMLADAVGREAAPHFEAALEMDTRMGSVHHRTETLARYSAHLRRSDPKRSEALKREAMELAGLMGSTRVMRLTERKPDILPDGLTPREREVLELVALGNSNREIAERLFISEKTAAHHVSSILMKTGSENRTQAARYATEHGLDGSGARSR